MTDAGRKGMGDKLSESAKPDSQKSTLEKGQEAVTDAGDKVAGSVQPSGDKGIGQKASDTASSGSDKGILDQAKDTLGMGNK